MKKEIKKMIVVVIVLMVVVCSSCSNQKNDMISEVNQTVEFNESKIEVSIDSLNVLGIDIMLWVETKESFGHQLTPVCEIPIGFYFPMQDRRLNWALIKQEMIVNQTDVEILKNLKSQKLVVIGNYSTADEHKIRFTGYVYAY